MYDGASLLECYESVWLCSFEEEIESITLSGSCTVVNAEGFSFIGSVSFSGDLRQWQLSHAFEQTMTACCPAARKGGDVLVMSLSASSTFNFKEAAQILLKARSFSFAFFKLASAIEKHNATFWITAGIFKCVSHSVQQTLNFIETML